MAEARRAGSMAPVVETAQVVIVGAGIVGASVAFHLVQAGVNDVVVLDAAQAGGGATAKATGGIRQQFDSAINVRLSIESARFFEQFEARVGTPLRFRQCGYLFLTDAADRAAALRHSVAMQQQLGVPVQLLSPDAVAGLVPGIELSHVQAASFCSADGLASPTDACSGFLSAAKHGGVRVFEDRPATGIGVIGGRVREVQTSSGPIACEVVVNAAGVGSPAVARYVGVDLPVAPHHRQVFVTDRFDRIPDGSPFTVDLDSGAYFHKESAGVILGGTDDGDTRALGEYVDWDLVPRLVGAVSRRMPPLADAAIKRGWAGLREMTPDEHAIVGALDEPAGFLCATGFSGHGFMHSPAVGRIVATLIAGGPITDLDLAPLAPQRFAGVHPHASVAAAFHF